ncbi:hypothetical protein NQ318_011437 [Aromia moschata]|uniref:K Homology domain-containing protein n=1 Tax=Aromia moschata TaxID=1265417 RepID=A0AAV8YUX7_9CUCU|nr:hypothetical protein NQ318_011437 [Aromia moschata]
MSSSGGDLDRLRVHSRLIGSRGRNIRKIMEDYNVDIKFPRNDDPDPNLVIISGQEENVTEARDHLLNLEEEYDGTGAPSSARRRGATDPREAHSEHALQASAQAAPPSRGRDPHNNGFVVQGGPWEQRAPNTASVTEFPSFGGGRNAEELQAPPRLGRPEALDARPSRARLPAPRDVIDVNFVSARVRFESVPPQPSSLTFMLHYVLLFFGSMEFRPWRRGTRSVFFVRDEW